MSIVSRMSVPDGTAGVPVSPPWSGSVSLFQAPPCSRNRSQPTNGMQTPVLKSTSITWLPGPANAPQDTPDTVSGISCFAVAAEQGGALDAAYDTPPPSAHRQ